MSISIPACLSQKTLIYVFCVIPAHTMYIITIDAHMSYVGVVLQHSFEEQRGQVGSVVHNEQQLVPTFNARYAVLF